jgi:hypothetical protein
MELINNAAWLDGYDAFWAGEDCPWDDLSGRAGWCAAYDAEVARIKATTAEAAVCHWGN